MEVYVKEALHVLDYKENIVDTIFLSNDNLTPGYAYEVTITEANTGYSDLKFKMPNMIIDDQGNQVLNPKLALMTPLVKLRYHREVYYTGTEPITVREPQGYGDEVSYIDRVYSNVYPDNIIEDYIMDYIVQPIDRNRDVLKLTTQFTAIDYPRFNLSKKRVGLTINEDTLTKDEWTLYENKPMSVPGTIQYQQWTNALGQYSTVYEWDPENAKEYPLDQAAITQLMNNSAVWPYGLLGTAFYWPIVSTARYEGVLYKKGGFLVLQLYDFYANVSEAIDPNQYADYGKTRYGWDWTQLYEVDSYLTPNNARNYLAHILNGTNWSVGDVDVVQSEIPNPAGSLTDTTLADDTCNISVSNSNCYNAITAVCQGLQLYPVFDCINRTVSLKVFAGKNYGLVYRMGSNLKTNAIKNDGEKVITKLYVEGGKDYNGDTNINIGEAERSYLQMLTGIYTSTSQLPTSNVQGYWAKVGSAIYFYNNGSWVKGTDNGNGTWSYGNYVVDGETGAPAPWDPNDPMYVNARSPYGTNYILNFKWMYDNGWISKQEILDLYDYEKQLDTLNREFIPDYTQNLVKTQNEYNEAVNNYQIAQDDYESTLNAMMNKYYIDDTDVSKGMEYCFHVAPQGTYLKSGKHYVKVFHCYECGHTQTVPSSGTTAPSNLTECPACSKTSNYTNKEIYIPVYSDFSFSYSGSSFTYGENDTALGAKYDPHLKGYFLRLVMNLDRQDNSDEDYWTINDYEKKIYLTKTIDYTDKGFDGYNYTVGGVYVRSVSGQIEVWNEAVVSWVKSYGQMLDYLRQVEKCQERLDALAAEYQDWAETSDGLHTTIQELYGDFIIEGNYKNEEQPYVGLLFKEGMEASDKFAIPQVTYTLDVIDSTGLIEYRQPMVTQYECTECDYLTFTQMDTCPRCNSKKILTHHDTYNDLVRLLHSVGQIVPKAGDYATIYDEAMGMYGVPGLITEISRTLDKPVNNKIKLDTGYTDDEELVGNIINATNTVLNNSDIYARTAVLKADGTIDSDSIRSSIDNPNANISIVGTAGSILLSGAGLRCTDASNPSRAMKYAGNGVFKTTTLTESGEGTVWEKIITPDGINATYLNAGTIDTNKLTVTSGLYGSVVIDQYGLSVKKKADRSIGQVAFDTNRAMNDINYDWSALSNRATFVGVDKGNQPLMYTSGFIMAKEGSRLGGWVSDSDSIYHLTNSSGGKDLWLSTTGKNKSGTVNGHTDNWLIYAKGKFGVDDSGVMHANGATITGSGTFTGKIIVNDSNSTVNTGSVGGWSASDSGLSKSGIWLSPGGLSGTVNGSTQNYSLYVNGNFGVTPSGILYANGAHINGDGTFSGTIKATAGNIGGWNIDNVQLQKTVGEYSVEIRSDRSATDPCLLVYKNSGDNQGYKFYVRPDGYLYAGEAHIKGKIEADSLTLHKDIQIGTANLKYMTEYVDGKVGGVIEITNAKVNITDLAKGTTSIDGACIKTGKISCDFLSGGVLRGQIIRNGGSASDTDWKVQLDSKGIWVLGDVHTYGSGGNYTGWHTGITPSAGIVICRDIDLMVGQYMTLWFNNGILVGYTSGRSEQT